MDFNFHHHLSPSSSLLIKFIIQTAISHWSRQNNKPWNHISFSFSLLLSGAACPNLQTLYARRKLLEVQSFYFLYFLHLTDPFASQVRRNECVLQRILYSWRPYSRRRVGRYKIQECWHLWYRKWQSLQASRRWLYFNIFFYLSKGR